MPRNTPKKYICDKNSTPVFGVYTYDTTVSFLSLPFDVDTENIQPNVNMSSQLHTSAALPPGKENPVRIG
jgi:hypothetical protein